MTWPDAGLSVYAGMAPVFPANAISLVQATQNSISLSWTAASGLAITNYQLYFDNGDGTGGSINTQIYSGTGNTFTQTGPNQ